jgi:hypothetical protein
MPTKTTINKKVGEIFKVLCSQCKNVTNHKVISSVGVRGDDDSEESDYYGFSWNSDYQIIQCQGCEEISFRQADTNSEEFDQEGSIITELIFPKRGKNSWNIKAFLNVPYNLRRLHRETIDCYNNENLTLCGAGVRGLVEGICNENNIQDGEVEVTNKNGDLTKRRLNNLQGKINGLFEKGILTKKNTEILHEHRYLGNSSIHDLAKPTKEELGLALEIIEHVFDTIYEIPERADQLSTKRRKRES